MESRKAFTEKVLSQISSKVLHKPSRNEKALIVFFGSNQGMDEGINLVEDLSKIRETFSIISPSCLGILTEIQRAKLINYTKIITQDNQKDYYNQSLKDGLVIIATLTKNSCSKLGLGIGDTLASAWVIKAVSEGANIICTTNGVLDDLENLKFKEVINSRLKSLRDFGIKLVDKRDLRENIFINNQLNYTTSVDATDGQKKVYTEKIISKIEDCCQLVIKAGDIITPLAKDLIKQKKIHVKYQDRKLP